jgi:hypothetical protein
MPLALVPSAQQAAGTIRQTLARPRDRVVAGVMSV